MPQRFGQRADSSQNFAYLARTNSLQIRDRAQAVDRAREEELAAKDAEVFTRYQAGKISGASLLRYIRSRVAATSYDKAQQRKWAATLVQYQGAISDERAAAKFAEDGNISSYLQHFRSRLASTKSGTPERTRIQEQVKTLQAQADAEHIRSRATRIRNKIAKGDMTIKDLIDFYRTEKGNLPPGSNLRVQLNEKMAELKTLQTEQRLKTRMQEINTKMAAGVISPAMAADQKQKVIDNLGIKTSSPAVYAQFQEEIRKLNATPDPIKVAKLEQELLNGDVTADAYLRQVNKWADAVRPFDRVGAIEMVTAAQVTVRDLPVTTLPNFPGGLADTTKGPRASATSQAASGIIGRSIQHITQNDGSDYSNLNCTMAAAAMLGHTMGRSGLTGGKLRYSSRDREGGTTLVQAQYALQVNGVKNTKIRYHNRIEFAQFTRNLKQGAPAVLSGFNGSLSGKFSHLNASGVIGGHSVYVAKFHPKKGYLVLDPAKSKDKGTWWPAEAMESFGWGGVSGNNTYRYGQVLMAPRNTLATRWNGGQGRDSTTNVNQRARRGNRSGRGDAAGAGPAISHVSVHAAGGVGVPEVYVGQYAQGSNAPDVQASAMQTAEDFTTKVNESGLTLLDDRLINAGITDPQNNAQWATEELDRRQEANEATQVWIAGAKAEYTPGDEEVTVTIGDETRTFTPEDITGLYETLLFGMDAEILLHEWMGEGSRANSVRLSSMELAVQGRGIVTIDAGAQLDRLVSTGLAGIDTSDGLPDPSDVWNSVDVLLDVVSDFANEAVGEGPEQGPENLADPRDTDTQVEQQVEGLDDLDPTMTAKLNGLLEIKALLDDPEMASIERNAAISQIALANGIDMGAEWDTSGEPSTSEDPLGAALAAITNVRNVEHEVERGETMYLPVQNAGSNTSTFYPVAVDPETNLPDLTTAPEHVLDRIKEHYGAAIMDATQLPKGSYVMDGIRINGVVVPDMQPSEKMFLKLADVKGAAEAVLGRTKEAAADGRGVELELSTGENRGYISGDQLATVDPDTINLLINEGYLVPAPNMRPAFTSQGFVDPDGNMTLGITSFYDPATEQWHENALPSENPTEGFDGELVLATGFGLNYQGAKFDDEFDNSPEPDIIWDPDTMSPAGNGVPAIVPVEISKDEAQTLYESGAWGTPVDETTGQPLALTRDAQGEVVQQTPEQIANVYSNADQLWSDAIRPYVDQFKLSQEEELANAELLSQNEQEYVATLEAAGFTPDLEPIAGPLPGGAGVASIGGDTLAELRETFGIGSVPDAASAQGFNAPPPPSPELLSASVRFGALGTSAAAIPTEPGLPKIAGPRPATPLQDPNLNIDPRSPVTLRDITPKATETFQAPPPTPTDTRPDRTKERIL